MPLLLLSSANRRSRSWGGGWTLTQLHLCLSKLNDLHLLSCLTAWFSAAKRRASASPAEPTSEQAHDAVINQDKNTWLLFNGCWSCVFLRSDAKILSKPHSCPQGPRVLHDQPCLQNKEAICCDAPSLPQQQVGMGVVVVTLWLLNVARGWWELGHLVLHPSASFHSLSTNI